MHNERQIWGIQRRQLGLVTARQCAEHGLSRKIVARLVAAGRWARVLPGVFRECVHPESHEQMTLAATLWAAPSGIASHAASGFLMRLDGVRFDRPHLWVPSTRSARSDLVVVHRGEIEAVDRRMIGPVPVTSPARTLVDLAGVLEDEDLEAAAASRLEVKIWRTLRAAGMRPVRQHRLRVGDRTYFVDCAFPQWRLAVEGVGDRYHRSPVRRRRDHRRLADLASVQWRVLPVTWREITDSPDAVVARVMRSLTAAA